MDIGNPDRPPQITAAHLALLCLVYARQSTVGQVTRNFGSTIVQRELADIARGYGWPEASIRIMDDDLGLSGTSGEFREDYRQTIDLMQRGLVGMLMILDASRLARRPLEAEVILQLAIRYRVLIHMGGKLFDPANAELHELLNIRVQNLFAWLDNANRVRNLTAAKLAKARNGHAVTMPPRGYVVSVRGQWVKDESPVQEAVSRAFELYPQLGSLNKVMRYFRAQQWLFPTRRHGRLEWRPLTTMQLAHMLRNPQYTGRLVYKRMKVYPKTSDADLRHVEFLDPSRWTFAVDKEGQPILHHEPYISWETFLAIQTMLSNQRVKKHPPILDGPAILTGLVRCGPCDRRVRTVYQMKVKGRRLPSYVCRRTTREGIHLRRCFTTPAALLDTVIIRGILQYLPTVDVEALRTTIRNASRERERAHRARQQHLSRLDAEEAQAKQRYESIQDPAGNSLVRLQLEREWQAAMETTAKYRAELTTVTADPPVMRIEDAEELAERLQSIERIWRASTTSNDARKRLLRLVIRGVDVRQSSPSEYTAAVQWLGGVVDEYVIARPAGVREMVAALSGLPPMEIVRRLQARGVLTRSGRPVTASVVNRNLRLLRRASPPEAPSVERHEQGDGMKD